MGLCENCKITMCRAERDDVIGCAEFVAKDTNVLTNADRIRAMSDEELAQNLLQFNTLEGSVPFCRNLAECDELLDTEDGIPEEKCKQCLLNWLRQPAEVEL